MIVFINARPSTPSYNPLFEQVPNVLDRFFQDHSYLVIYPEQETGNSIPDILTGDQTQASTTWTIVSWIKQSVLRLLSALQTKPTNQKASHKTNT